MKLANLVIGCCAIVALMSQPVSADLIHITSDPGNSTENTGVSFDASVIYNFIGGVSGIVTVSLTNTTDPLIGGLITGFLFNVNSVDSARAITFISGTNPNFVGLQNATGSPFGIFEAGAAVSGNFEGGGSPSGGIPVGGTATFDFAVSASDASALSAMSFLTGSNQFNFVVRFRGVGAGGEDSDKVPAMIAPAPGTAAALLLAGLFGGRRRR